MPVSGAMLLAQLIGTPTIHYDGRPVQLANRKSRALLAYLLLTDKGREKRERLVGLLWSETDDTRARASLRQALYETRAALGATGYDGFEADKFDVGLRAASFEVDIVKVLEQVKAGVPHRLLLEHERLTDQLLDGCDTIDPAFDVWLTAKREAIRQRIERDLETALRASSPGGPHFEDLARSILNLDPTHEEAARALMNARHAAGDTAGALAVYKKLWDLLDAEYDTEPSKETQDLVAAIKLGQPTVTRAEPATSPAPAKPTQGLLPAAMPLVTMPGASQHPQGNRWSSRFVLSVAPFELAGARQEQLHLVHGFRRELLACLTRFREWLVRDIGPAGGRQLAPLDNTEEYTIEGSTVQSGAVLRLVLTLKEAATGVLLWSERLELSAAEWMNAQQTVMRRLAAALKVNVSAERMSIISPRPDDGLKVFDTWLRGQALILSFDPKDWHRAAELFRTAINEARGFAPAYSSLAQLQNTIHFVHPGIFRSTERTADALSYAREAARLDPVDSRAHLALGWAHAFASQHEQAAAHHELAHELNDNDPWTSTSAGLGFAFGGDTGKARAFLLDAASHMVDPMPIHWRYRTIVEHISGNYAASLAAADQATSSVPNELGWKVSALYHLGEKGEAAKELKRFYALVAQRWCGSTPPNEEVMVRWFLHLFPMRRAEDWEHLREGLAGAGAPVTGLSPAIARPTAHA
ncbi:MAG TPA: BTAD domain-containing putative transcriptional regulator [Hyphomicrobiaceae bacterium]|nr:BTAD domain-containing putative transcriptional regulator [Hyphomicrobiaceae bacterium]